jgi:hypothetical protein
MEYTENWQKNLTYDEWQTFLNFSKSDCVCNKMWIDYRNQTITYDEVSRYEFNLYLRFLRDKKLETVLPGL